VGAENSRLAELEQRIGHVFKNRTLLDEALTHASVLETGAKARKTYERLEFLGDRVLGLIMAEKLHADYPDQGESGLATRFNALVNRTACARAARRAGIGPALSLAVSEESQGGRDKEQILGDACESVIAALYVDGGFDAARAFVLRFWEVEFDAVKVARRDPKTVLQEWAAARKKALTYALIDRSGPEHAPVFVVEARVEGLKPARGEGKAKREAERAAAAAFIAQANIHG
jgi:ribonuclease III